MKEVGLFALALTTAVSLSCGPRRYEPIEVSASDFDLMPLVGRWSGNYASNTTGRSGSITFTLQAGEASAYGDIVMIPRGPARSAVPLDQHLVGADASGTVREILTIHFVRKEGNKVIGVLDPYRDPDCGCKVITTFEGEFHGRGAIEGTFTTKSPEVEQPRAAGEWKVTRVKRL